MSKIIQLIALSFLLMACKSMYNNSQGEKVAIKKDQNMEADVTRRATHHIHHVTDNASGTASAASTAAKSAK